MRQLKLVPVAKITTGDRVRKSLGDIEGLAASIQETTLLQPLVVDPQLCLISGERRLTAIRRLGWEKVAVLITDELDTAIARIKAERDENECRKALTPEELVRAAERLAELEKPKAKARQAATQPQPGEQVGAVPRNSTSETGYVRDKVAKALGTSGPTYQRMKKVVDVANDPTQPDEVRAIASEALEEMNETGKVTPAYSKVATAIGLKPHRQPVPKEEKPSKPSENGSASSIRKGRRLWKGNPAEEVMDKLVSTLRGAVSALEATDLTPAFAMTEKTDYWNSEISNAIRYLNKVRKQLTVNQEKAK